VVWVSERTLFDQIDQITLQAHHDRLRLGIAETAVEFERFGIARFVDHHPGVEKAGVGNAVLRHSGDRRQDDFAHDARVHLRCHDGRGRVGTHTTSVGAGIAIKQTLVVLA